jgi:hypothetical protein
VVACVACLQPFIQADDSGKITAAVKPVWSIIYSGFQSWDLEVYGKRRSHCHASVEWDPITSEDRAGGLNLSWQSIQNTELLICLRLASSSKYLVATNDGDLLVVVPHKQQLYPAQPSGQNQTFLAWLWCSFRRLQWGLLSWLRGSSSSTGTVSTEPYCYAWVLQPVDHNYTARARWLRNSNF